MEMTTVAMIMNIRFLLRLHAFVQMEFWYKKIKRKSVVAMKKRWSEEPLQPNIILSR